MTRLETISSPPTKRSAVYPAHTHNNRLRESGQPAAALPQAGVHGHAPIAAARSPQQWQHTGGPSFPGRHSTGERSGLRLPSSLLVSTAFTPSVFSCARSSGRSVPIFSSTWPRVCRQAGSADQTRLDIQPGRQGGLRGRATSPAAASVARLAASSQSGSCRPWHSPAPM